MRRQKKADAPVSPGAFLSDGRFLEEGEMRHRGHVDGLTRALVRQRRSGRLSVSLAVAAVRAANASIAFPSVDQWEAVENWPLCHAATSAEEAVKREGNGTVGHWCGQRYAAGPEKDCPDERHRTSPMPEDVKAQLEALGVLFAGNDAPPPML